MLCVAADRMGAYGNQLWIRHKLGATVIHWQDLSTRFMYAVIKLPNGHIIVAVVLHAPQSKASETVKSAFYAHLWEHFIKLRDKYAGASFRCFVDANGRVGSTESACLGRHDAEKENDGGTRLRLFCEQFGMALANTFWPAGPTWTSTLSTQHRIDYVITEANALGDISICEVANDIDLTFNAYEDHKPTFIVEIFSAVVGEACADLVKPFKFNKHNLAVPERVEYFRSLVWKFSATEDEDIDDHLERLNEHMRVSALAAFGRPSDVPKKSWIAPATWSIIN